MIWMMMAMIRPNTANLARNAIQQSMRNGFVDFRIVREDYMTNTDPYAEGMEAAHSGQSAAHCSYQYGTHEGDEWLRGFQDGGGND